MGIWYVSREAVKVAMQNTTTRDDASIDRAIEAASRAIEGFTKREFYPTVKTIYRDWPDPDGGAADTLWLDGVDLLAATTVTADNGATTIPPSSVRAEPNEYGPPYDHIVISDTGTAQLSAGNSSQRAIGLSGTFGYTDADASAGTLAATINSSVTTVTVSDASLVGIGSIIRVGTERMIVTGRRWASTGTTLSADLAATKATTSMSVVSGAAINPGEFIIIDGEKMRLMDVVSNTGVVERGVDGYTLAGHTSGATLYAARQLTVTRGALGTTAASHNTSDPVYVLTPPALVVQWVTAQAIATMNQNSAGYAATAGEGDNQREITGRALAQLTQQVKDAYARRARTRAV